MKYKYEVIESKSPELRIGTIFISKNKLHDDRRKDKTAEYSDVACRDWKIKLLGKIP